MQAIRRKLNSQKGASMLMALLLMLVGIMVSAVIISAATSAAVNKRSEKEQQQAYLAVSSAAELVRDDFQSLTGRYKDVTTTVTHADGTTTTTNDTIKATCAVGDMINDIGARFIGVNTTSTYAKTYTFSVDGYEDVSAEILVSVGTGSDESSKVYNLTATFTNGVGSEHPCRMVLTMEGKLTEERTSGDTGSTLTTTISDELRYSGTLKVDGSGNVTGFFSQQFGSGDYTAFTTTPEGHVQLGGKDILPAKAYPYGIKAEVKSLTYDDVSSLFTVRLSVKDSENKNTLAETTFEVEKLNVTTEDTAEGHARAEDIRNTEN